MSWTHVDSLVVVAFLVFWRRARRGGVVLWLLEQLVFKSVLVHQALIRVDAIENVTASPRFAVRLHVLNHT